MKITIPENISEITLDQFQKYEELLKRTDLTDKQKIDRKISLFTNIPYKDCVNISNKDYEEILQYIDIALSRSVEFQPVFKLSNVEFGFIPNLDNITHGEFVDLDTYQLKISDMHKLMAVLFRPIKDKDKFGNYSIIDYNGTKEFADVMKLMPLSIVNGSLVFFSNLSNELKNYILRYTDQLQAKEV